MQTIPQPAKRYNIPVYQVRLVRETSLAWEQPKIRSAADAAALFHQYLANVDREHFVVALLDQKNKVIGIHTVSVGSLTASVVHPREVFKTAILANAAALVLGHNHPSGVPEPSREDRDLTARLVEGGTLLGLKVLDHIIIGDGSTRYYSFTEQGLL